MAHLFATRPGHRRAAAVAALAALLAPAGRAVAQNQTDRQQQQGVRSRQALIACDGGDVAKGVALLADLYAETKDPGHVFNQARCYQQNEQIDPALQRFREYLRVGTAEPPADIARAQGYVRELEGILAARQAEEQKRAQATAAVAAAAAGQAAGSERRLKVLRVTSIVLGGIGLASLGTGAYLSSRVRSLEGEIEQRFKGQQVVTDNAPLKRQLADGGRYETWQWIAYGVGVAAAAGAVTTFALAGFTFSSGEVAGRPATVSLAPVATPSAVGAVVRGRF
jgi:hypothetical protein